MFKKIIPILIIVLAFIQLPAVNACSGGGPAPTVSDWVSYADVIVQGHMDMVDERRQNGVLQVESVLSGGDIPQYILLDIAPSSFIYRVQERNDSGGCFYGVSPLPQNQPIIFFLKKLPNGAYHLAMLNYYAFPSSDTVIPIYKGPPTKSSNPSIYTSWLTQLVDRETFTYLIGEAVGQPPHPPKMNTPYPLPTSLYIRTVNGTEYELPVNFSPPQKLTSKLANENGEVNSTGCKIVNCIGTSPNGIDGAQVMPDATVNMLSFINAVVPGTAFRFSTTSDALAVWNADTLSVYALPYDRFGLCCYQLFLINQIALNNVLKPMTDVAWTPDGRVLAYSDSTGLYLWDVFTSGSRPRLLSAPLYETVTPRFFSKTGRYLAIQRGASRFYLDMVSGMELPDGILSPDDRVLLQFTTLQPSTMQIYQLAPYRAENDADPRFVNQAQWIDRNRYLIADCSQPKSGECLITLDALLIGAGGQFEGYAFAYDNVTSTLAIAMIGKRIGIINLSRDTMLHTYDFSNYLEGEIQTIAWMSPIFFQPGL